MNRGDIVLVRIPFVGAPGGKVRPALVVQNDALNAALRETVIVEITSNVAHARWAHQLLIEVSKPEAAGTGLLTDSAVRCDRLHTIPQSDVKRIVGRFSPAVMSRIDECLKSALGIL
jgi:mRNA-degrading endonuclease toxin of MazEF toxin-antitoxin module